MRDDGGMLAAYEVAAIRQAEAAVMQQVGADALMERAAFGLSVHCARILQEQRGFVTGADVVVLVGSGNNGGDAMWAGAYLARRGARVTAILLAPRWHVAGAEGLVAAGGRLVAGDLDEAIELVASADLVLDGIVGIGGKGALTGDARELAAHAAAGVATIVAVDLPSGVDADTGAVADQLAVIEADYTVTFGCYKPGLLVPPASECVGQLRLVDIGLGPAFSRPASIQVMDDQQAALALRQPGAADDKYTRGVVGVVAGSKPYPGAGILCTGSSRLGGAGFVRYAGSVPDAVINHWPEVVLEADGPGNAGRVQSWVIGPGGGTDSAAKQHLRDVLDSDQVAVVDADALTLVASDDAMRSQLIARADQGRRTVLTPHAGELARLGYPLPTDGDADRIGVVRKAAAEFGAVVLLKGHTTTVAAPDGYVVINTVSSSALATAGSGDVLAGLLGSMLASAAAHNPELADHDVVDVTAGAAYVHGVAGRIAADDDEPVTALSVLEALPAAIAIIRGGAE